MAYKFDSIVNKSEADALKDMIFRRVQERSKGMSDEVQTDVMDLARDSFVSKDNPFQRLLILLRRKKIMLLQKFRLSQKKKIMQSGFR